MMGGDTAMLVVSDTTNTVWIIINEDAIMEHHHTQNVNYRPIGLYNDTRCSDGV